MVPHLHIRKYLHIIKTKTQPVALSNVAIAPSLMLYDLQKMKLTLILLNLVAAALVFPAINILNGINGMGMQGFYVDLDRAQLIDQEKVKSFFPEEAKNDRHLIPEKFMKNRNKNAWILGYPCIFGFMMNAILLAVWRKPKVDPDSIVNSVTAPPPLRD